MPPRKKATKKFDDSFYQFASLVTQALEDNEDGTLQKEQVEGLMEAERRFKDSVLKYAQAKEIYKKFVLKIVVEERNILNARPYFREKAPVFSSGITPAIRDGDIEKLQKYDINYNFIKFIRDNWKGTFPKKCDAAYKDVEKKRSILIENNIPLAINRAKIFYRKVPESHMDFMDFIMVCCMGLISGIDKYVGEYRKVFRSVCIGRMVGNMVDNYSETVLHFYPSDRKVLYRANALRYREKKEDINDLVDAINDSFDQDKAEGKKIPKKKITVAELSDLLNSSSIVSVESTTEDSEGFGIYDYTPADDDVEKTAIIKDAMEKVIDNVSELSIMERKVLRMKGVFI